MTGKSESLPLLLRGRREEATEWEGAADISLRLIRQAWDEEGITNSAHKCTPTYKQTIPLYSTNQYLSLPLSANQTPVQSLQYNPLATGNWAVPRSCKDGCHRCDPTKSSTAQKWPLASLESWSLLPYRPALVPFLLSLVSDSYSDLYLGQHGNVM